MKKKLCYAVLYTLIFLNIFSCFSFISNYGCLNYSKLEDNIDRNITTITDSIYEKYKLNVYYSAAKKNDIISFNIDKNKYEILTSLKAVQSQLNSYTPKFLRSIMLKSIYLVNNLQSQNILNGITIANYFAESYTNSNIYLNIDSDYFSASTLHHEIWHVIENRFPLDNIDWVNINPNAKYLYESDADNIFNIEQHPGFVNAQSYIDPFEDKATLFGLIMYPYVDDVAIAKYKGDQFLFEKSNILKEHIKTKLNVEFAEFDSFFKLPNFYFNSLYTLKQGYAASYGTTLDYYVFNPQGNIFYSVENLVNPEGKTALLDGNGKLFYADKSALEKVNLNYQALTNELLKSFKLSVFQMPEKNESIKFDNIDFNKNADLINAKLYEIIEVLKSHKNTRQINEIYFVTDIFEKQNQKSYIERDKKIYIDPITITYEDIRKIF